MSILYIVATPIGNLEDISRRALRILTEVDMIACEDTRQSLKLLRHYQIKKPLISFHAHNQKKAAVQLLKQLEKGRKIALVTDGGTPGISDPGSYLVKLARERDHRVEPIPGASALSTLLSVAGVSGAYVTFAGFLSPKPGRRKKRLTELLLRGDGIVLFESPHRIVKLLEDLIELSPGRRILLGREMTKMNEEFLEGFPKDLLTDLSGRARIVGEFTVFIVPCTYKKVQVHKNQ